MKRLANSAATLAILAGCTTSPSDSLLGAWKSDDLNLRVTVDSTAVWGNCTHGTIPGRLRANAAGEFSATFDYTFVGGAAGSQPVTTRMILAGRLSGGVLTVTLDAMTASAPVSYRLERGEGVPYLPCP